MQFHVGVANCTTPIKNSKINITVDGSSTSSHDNKKFRTRLMEKQRGMAFLFPEDGDSCCKAG